MKASCQTGTLSCTLGEEVMTETAVNTRSYYDHTHPDAEYFPPSAHCASREPAVDDIRTDQSNVSPQGEHRGPHSPP